MDDKSIVDLYFSRNQDAITQTDKKYGRYCYSIAYNILTNKEDAEESVSDTYMTAWRAIPPRRPSVLSTFLGKITRHISIDRWRERSAYKRGGRYGMTMCINIAKESGMSIDEIVTMASIIERETNADTEITELSEGLATSYAVQKYAVPKPSAECANGKNPCVLAINAILWVVHFLMP